MNVIQRKVLLSPCKNLLFQNSVRCAHWNKDWMPGPFPETPEERAAAAKKYGLLPEEYAPFPDDGLGRGDYPKIKDISADSRDPFYPYEFPEHKKNFGETMYAFSDIAGEDRCDFNVISKNRFSTATMFGMFFAVVGGSIGLTFLCKDRFFVSRPVLARHYSSEGVHYKY